MPNIETLIECISQIITNYKTEPHEKICFSTIKLKYSFIPQNLHFDTAKHCNFNIVSGDMSGEYIFRTGFWELIDIPAEFQKAIDNTRTGLNNTLCFPDDT